MVCAAKVIDGRKVIWLLDAVAGTGGKLVFAAASGCVDMIFDAASEHFRMVNQIVNIKTRMVAAVAGTLSYHRIWRLLSVATKLGPSIGPRGPIVQRG